MFLEDFADAFVGKRILGVLLADAFLDEGLDAFRADLTAVIKFQRAVEEEFEFVYPERRRHILVRGDAADGGLVHVDVVGDVFQDKRLEFADPFLEEAPLVLHDAFHDLVQRPLTLMQALDEPCRRPDFFVEVFFFLAGRAFRGVFVRGVQMKIRQAVVVEDDEEFAVHLVDEDVRADEARHALAETGSGHGIEGLDDVEVLLEFVHVQLELAEQRLVAVGFEVLQVIAHQIDEDLIPIIPEGFYLDEETFLRSARGDADGIKKFN